MALSLMEIIAELPPAEQEAALADLDPESLVWDWSMWGRPEQQAPPGQWAVWLYMAGRGAGKTRTAAEWIRDKALVPGRRFALVARTAADTRDVIVEGESGILNVTPPSEMPKYEPSKRRLTWPNGNVATLFTADEPDSLRGPQFTHAWGDEVAAWRLTPDGAGLTAFDNLRFGTRLRHSEGEPQMILTTTPKRVPILYKLLEEQKKHPERVVITRGSTLDNSGNLPAGYLENLTATYSGRVSAQEIYGEMLEALEGALWNEEMIDFGRTEVMPPRLPLRVVGVDPSVAEKPGDECGIVVVGSTAENEIHRRHAYVLEDASLQAAPQMWAQKVVEMSKKWGAPVVAEINQGGALVANAIHQIDPTVKVLEVRSMVGKQLRAEPVALCYEQGRVHHVGRFDGRPGQPGLEPQMVNWLPEDTKSPDRIDALVHGLTALLIKPPAGLWAGGIRARSSAARRLPGKQIGGGSAGGMRIGGMGRRR